MNGQRREQGGIIDRSQPLDFFFDGRRFKGFAGDTLASALLAGGQRLITRSFKYHFSLAFCQQVLKMRATLGYVRRSKLFLS